jgi:alkylation response protein AidB-like acyl-CoA dehydrogenase
MTATVPGVDLGIDEEQRQLVASFNSLLSKASPPERVRAAEPGGVDEALWRSLQGIGAVTMAVPEARGGWGASLVDLALVAEQLGRALAPAPVIEAQVAARLLAAVASGPALDALGRVVGEGELVTVAVRPPQGGVAALTPAGAVCDAAVVLDGDRLALVPVTAANRRPVANLASAPLADVDMAGGTELARGPDAVERFEAALDEWLALTAAALVGIGAGALELGCAYAAERRAFGVPIGTFQAVAHPLADDATSIDGARLLAQKAAWALDGDGDGDGSGGGAAGAARGRELAAMAFAFASGAAAAATYDALHVHGGYGFMLEYDVQLHYRRARGWPRVWGDADAAYRRAAQARYGSTTGGR